MSLFASRAMIAAVVVAAILIVVALSSIRLAPPQQYAEKINNVPPTATKTLSYPSSQSNGTDLAETRSSPSDAKSSLVLSAKPSTLVLDNPSEDEGPVTATATVRRQSGQAASLKSIDGLFKQVLLNPMETVQIQIDLSRFAADKSVRVAANNGGSINRQLGPISIDPIVSGAQANFTFGVGATPGSYTVEIMQGNRTELMDFWVGLLPPRGEAGPPKQFPASTSQ